MTDERKKDAEETQPKEEEQHQKDEPEKREKSQSPNPNPPTEKKIPADDSDTGKSHLPKESIPQKPPSVPTPPTERQVIAVSASKNPAAFFNLARRFLVTDEFCDLSALEGAIVSAVDAAHLLERSKLANIVRYVMI